jgi:hypothetical protein
VHFDPSNVAVGSLGSEQPEATRTISVRKRGRWLGQRKHEGSSQQKGAYVLTKTIHSEDPPPIAGWVCRYGRVFGIRKFA